MVTPAGNAASPQGSGARPDFAFPPITLPRQQNASTDQNRPATNAEDMGRQQAEQARQRAEDKRAQEQPQTQATPQDISLQYRIIQQAHLAQARIINDDTHEVLREVPQTARIVFDLHFDELIGRHLDTRA